MCFRERDRERGKGMYKMQGEMSSALGALGALMKSGINIKYDNGISFK